MSTPPAFQSQDAPKPLPFDPSKLKGLSEQMIRSHWENNYGGSVKAANIAGFMKHKDVDGALVGGASLDVDEFASIARFPKHVGTA